MLEVDQLWANREVHQVKTDRNWKYFVVAQQPGFRFVNSEVLTEARVGNLALQFGFGPSALRIRGQVRRKLQAGTVQIEKADDRNQRAGVQIPLGPLGEVFR